MNYQLKIREYQGYSRIYISSSSLSYMSCNEDGSKGWYPSLRISLILVSLKNVIIIVLYNKHIGDSELLTNSPTFA